MSLNYKKYMKIWSIEGFESRASELIRGGILNEGTFEHLHEVLKEEFAEEITDVAKEVGLSRPSMTKTFFKNRVEELIWSTEIMLALKKFVRYEMELDKFIELYAYIPEELIKRKAKELSGTSKRLKNATFMTGIHKIVSDAVMDAVADAYTPVADIDEPFVIPVEDVDNFKVEIWNGLHLGLIHNRVIEENVVRCAFADAQLRGVTDIFIAGGLQYLDVKKASGYTTAHRARTSGWNFDPEIMAPSYRERAKMLDAKVKNKEIIYVTTAELFLGNMSGFGKIAIKPDGDPEFEGNIWIFFGALEEMLMEDLGYKEALRETRVRQSRITVEKDMVTKALAVAEVNMDVDRVLELEEKLNDLLEELSRTTVTNISPEDKNRHTEAVRKFMIASYEQMIPNAKVISSANTAYVQLGKGGEIIQFVHDPRMLANDRSMDAFIKNHGIDMTRKGPLPSAIIVCNPHNTRYGRTTIEFAKDAKRESSPVYMPPVLLEKRFLSKHFRSIQRKSEKIEQLVRRQDFKPGIFLLERANGLWIPQMLSVEGVKRYAKRYTKRYAKNRYKPAYIHMLIQTDPHFGNAYATRYWDKQNQKLLYLGPAVFEMMRRSNLFKGTNSPIHSFQLLDDGVQGHHFRNETQTHEGKKTFRMLEQQLNEGIVRATSLVKTDPEKAIKEMEAMRELSLRQERDHGQVWLQDQLKEYFTQMIEENLDFFISTLLRWEKSGVEFKGISKYTGRDYDARDISVIGFQNGNHFASTIEDELTEGALYEQVLRSELSGRPEIANFKDNLTDIIRAPLYGNTSSAWGTVSAPGEYTWGLALRAQPAKNAGAGDPIISVIANLQQRGNYTGIHDGMEVYHISGDKHRDAEAHTPLINALMVASGTETDPYGERGFSPNNTHLAVISIPAEGPDSAPKRTLILPHNTIRDYFEADVPPEIDWEKWLPNPV